jgi:hypothetical protein
VRVSERTGQDQMVTRPHVVMGTLCVEMFSHRRVRPNRRQQCLGSSDGLRRQSVAREPRKAGHGAGVTDGRHCCLVVLLV